MHVGVPVWIGVHETEALTGPGTRRRRHRYIRWPGGNHGPRPAGLPRRKRIGGVLHLHVDILRPCKPGFESQRKVDREVVSRAGKRRGSHIQETLAFWQDPGPAKDTLASP